MTRDGTVDRVLRIVAGIAGESRAPVDAGPDTPLAEGGFWLDSTALLEVLVACEEEFDVIFDPDTDLSSDALRTAGSLAASIGRQRRTRE